MCDAARTGICTTIRRGIFDIELKMDIAMHKALDTAFCGEKPWKLFDATRTSICSESYQSYVENGSR
jgi:hypothetical protein